MRKEWALLWFFWVLGVSGCSIAPKVSDHGGIDLDSSFIFSEHDWVFRGRLAVKNNNVAESARIKWQHDSDGERLVLYGPLGRQLVVVLLMGESIVVDYGAGNKITLQDIAQGVDFGLGFAFVFGPETSLQTEGNETARQKYPSYQTAIF